MVAMATGEGLTEEAGPRPHVGRQIHSIRVWPTRTRADLMLKMATVPLRGFGPFSRLRIPVRH